MTDTMRRPLVPYPRDAARPLRTAGPGDRFASEIEGRRTVWSAYLGDFSAESDSVPLATRWLPLVEEVAAGRVPQQRLFPGSFYPAGFRAQVLAGCGLTHDPALDRQEAYGAAPMADRVHDVLGRMKDAATDDLVLTALTLNLLSQYRTVVDRLGPEARERKDPVLYSEVLRASYSASRSSEAAARPFTKIAGHEGWDPLHRLGAVIRLIAHYSRSTKDPGARRHWVGLGTRILEECAEDTFHWGLYRSHLERAIALHAWLEGDPEGAFASLDSSRRIAVDLQGSTDPARYTAALHAERLVLEAALKAFLHKPVPHGAADAEETAERITRIDPADPYSNLAAGDTFWIIGREEDALACFTRATAAGTLAGAFAAHRAASQLEQLGLDGEAVPWAQRARELDSEAA